MKSLIYILFSGIIFVFYIPFRAFSQFPENRISKEEYIELYKDIAIEKMNMYNIPASITLAQGILESGHGNSKLAKKANNHFGIKCHKEWNGKTFHIDDDAKNECFRKYKSPHDSFKDHSDFLSSRDRYSFLFELDINDYKGWAKGLKKAGYATNPKYPQLLINIIEEFSLYEHDKYYNKDFASLQKLQATKDVSYRKKNNSPDDFELLTIGAANRKIYINNSVKLIFAKKGDDFYKIAQDFNIYTWQVYKYNDLKKKDNIREGQMIYLEAKKNKGNKPCHIVQPGETLYDISQLYGIKLKQLSKYNTLYKNARLYPDQKIKLRR
jgi:uncharacterized FlgJ-related protein